MSTRESCDKVLVVVEQPDSNVASLLDEWLDDVHVESVADSETLVSTFGTVDCIVVGPGSTAVSAVIEAAGTLADVPVVVFRSAAAISPSAALDAGAADAIPEDSPDAIRLLGHRIETLLDHSRREREHTKTTNLLDALFERIPLHLYVKDADGRHLRVSHAYTSDPDQYIGKTDVDLCESDESIQTYADDLHVIQEDEPILHKREPVVQDDKERFSVDDLQSHYVDATLDDESVLSAIGDDYDGWVLTSKVPWYDADGDVAGLIGVSIDTSQQEAYRRLLERQNQRLTEFASVVSHDLRNPLNVASGYLELAQETGNFDYLGRVDDAHRRIDELIDDILTLARGGNDIDEVADVSLDTLIRGAWETVDTEGATLAVAEPLGVIRADETRVRELLENLFRNSVEHGARPASGRSTLGDSVKRSSTSNRTQSGDAVEHGGGDDGQERPVTVRVGRLADEPGFYVEDDGPGIPADTRDYVFEQGMTTAEDGTGFGLAIVRRVAEAHGWTVRVVDAVESGTGARFEIRGVRSPETSR